MQLIKHSQAHSEMLCFKCPLCLCDAITTQGHPWEGAQGELSSKVHIGEWVLHDVEQMPTVSHSWKQSPCAIPPTSFERLPWAHNTEDTEVKKRQSPFPVFGGEGEKKEEEQCRKDQYRKRCPSLSSLSTFAVPLLWHFHLPSACCSVERQCGVIASTELGKQTLP